MIISGGSRQNWSFFARHLTNTKDNARVQLVEVRGLLTENVYDSLREMSYIASGSDAKNFLYHADINPPEHEALTPEQWGFSVDQLEKNLGLEGQPRIVVQHEKEGRVHQHVVWLRIDENGNAISDSWDYKKHQKTSRELEREFGHEAVRNAHEKDLDGKQKERRPKNWEKFRGNKSGVEIDQVLQDCTEAWQSTDSGKSLRAALHEKGYLLCQGTRRDFCIVDPAGDVHSLARKISGARAADVRERLKDIDRESLPGVEEARKQNTAPGRDDSEAHQRRRRMLLEKEALPYMRDQESPEADEAQKAARRAEKAKDRRERRQRLLTLEGQIARNSIMASRDNLLKAHIGEQFNYTAQEATERAARIAAIEREARPYSRMIAMGQESQPPPAFWERVQNFSRHAAKEYDRAYTALKTRVQDTWAKYVETHAQKREQDSWQRGLDRGGRREPELGR